MSFLSLFWELRNIIGNTVGLKIRRPKNQRKNPSALHDHNILYGIVIVNYLPHFPLCSHVCSFSDMMGSLPLLKAFLLLIVVGNFFTVTTRAFNSPDLTLASLSQYERDATMHTSSVVRKNSIEYRVHDWLCFSILKGNHTELNILIQNAKVLSCDWVIYFYSDDKHRHRVQRHICDSLTSHTTGRVRHCGPSIMARDSYFTKVIKDYAEPSAAEQLIHINDTEFIRSGLKLYSQTQLILAKPVIYREVLSYLQDYSFIFLLDSDIVVNTPYFDFNLTRHIVTHGYPRPLMVAQPLLTGNVSFPHIFGHTRWRNSTYSDYAAVGCSFIEQQALIIDARFFGWYIRAILNPIVILHLVYMSSWGWDNILCSAAKSYSKFVLHETTDSSLSPICAILVSQTVHHADTKALQKTEHFELAGHKMLQLYQRRYPSWYIDTDMIWSSEADPIDWSSVLSLSSVADLLAPSMTGAKTTWSLNGQRSPYQKVNRQR